MSKSDKKTRSRGDHEEVEDGECLSGVLAEAVLVEALDACCCDEVYKDLMRVCARLMISNFVFSVPKDFIFCHWQLGTSSVLNLVRSE